MSSDEDLDSLNASVSQYEIQLLQVQNAIASSTPGQGRDELVSLAADIGELITLTKENISSLHEKVSPLPVQVNQNSSRNNDDPLADEYEIFKSEIEGLSSQKPPESNLDNPEEGSFNISDIQDELEALQGMKCQAPYVNHYGHTSYHNALVYCVDSADDVSSINEIQVKVMFTNPVERDMLPCPYFLDGECRFSGDKCRYSHGESVCLASLQEYREPRFSTVKPGSRVLAKNSDNLWHSAEVLNVTEGNICTVKLASNALTTDVNLHDILPLDQDVDDNKDIDDESSSEDSDTDGDVENFKIRYDPSLIEKSLLKNPPSLALGEWEKHTKGIGSSIMARMGYVTGTGLGKHGEGRVEPVEALVFPTGKSLDHCMNLKEHAAEGEDLFKVEKRLKRLQKKEERIQKQLYERKTQQKRLNIFDFINSKVGHAGAGKVNTNKTNEAECSKLKTESNRSLNVVGFRLGEDIRKVERDVIQLQEAVARHSEGSQTRNALMGKLQEKQNELQSLKNSEKNIDNEKARRKDHKKLSVF